MGFPREWSASAPPAQPGQAGGQTKVKVKVKVNPNVKSERPALCAGAQRPHAGMQGNRQGFRQDAARN